MTKEMRKAFPRASSARTIHGEALRAAVLSWREEVGKADRERLDALVLIASTERLKLSECVRVTFPELPRSKALAAFTSFRKRINDAAAEAKPALKLQFQVDSQKQSPPEERECWFIGPELHETIPSPGPTEHFQRTKGASIALRDLERQGGAAPDNARDALSEIEAWAVKEDAPPFFALLGEYGIGKTTTLKHLTREFLERRKAGENLPLPLYFDLRDFVPQTKDAIPTIEELLASIIQRSWKLLDRSVTPEAVLRLVREEGAVILFDGLDERIVHLSPGRAREFIRTLWSVLPDVSRRADPLPPGKRRGKLLISCRSHYFRDVWSQNAMLVGEDREGLDRGQFPAFCLVPFSEEQIRSYLKSLLHDEERVVNAFDLIASIHDLSDLARRPYLLKLLTEQVAELENFKARGEKVNAARLYELVVKRWLSRDDGKHQFEPAHKQRLMEELAAALWRSGSKQWEVDRLEEWLDQYLLDNRVLADAYANKDRAILKEDLRTATFVLRPDVEREHFRFAHTSLQEYFLASYLVRALEEGRREAFNLPMVSDETLDFMGQILSLGRRAEALRTMEAILGGDHLGAAMIAFRYWLRSLERSMPIPSPGRVNLSGADLEGWTIRGPEDQAPLRLRGANLSSARLNRARVGHVDLSEANLSDLEARQALFLNVNARRAVAMRADFCGLQWRGGSLHSADLTAAQLPGCQWIGVDLFGATLPKDWRALAVSAGTGETPACSDSSSPAQLTVFGGHSGWVQACAWSPIGDRILSGSYDGTLNVWDAASGQCLITFKGHSGPVQACAWSPSGGHVLSGSYDGTLKVWDATSGDCLLTLKGHSRPVIACGWSPDGQRLVSGADDSTLKVWDAMSGDCLLTLKGHSGPVLACSWSPKGQRLVSGADDSTLKVWDATSGDCLLTLKGHSGPVLACGWSPEGQQIVSGSEDNTIKIWDAASGQCLLTVKDQSGRVQDCSWSPSGDRILSGSDGGTLKVWESASGQCLLAMKGHSGPVKACGWSPSGDRILSGSNDSTLSTLKVWDVASGQCLLTLKGHSGQVQGCSWSPSGDRILSGSNDSTLKVWDVASGQCLLTLKGHSGPVRGCGWNPSGDHVLSGSNDSTFSTLKVWDVASGRYLLTLKGHAGPVQACGWSPSGDRILSGSDDGTLKVWDVASGQCLLTLKGHSDPVLACGWSPGGDRIVSGSKDKSLKVWDVVSGQCLLTLEGHSGWVLACGWSPGGDRIVSGSEDNTLKVWDVASGQCLLTLEGHSGWVLTCGWSPGGDRVLSGSDDNTLKIWDVSSGQCLFTLKDHSGPVRACEWSPIGNRILSGSDDSTFKVWEPASGQCLWTGYLLPEGQTASIDEVNQRVLHASPEAWRWLGWRVKDPETGRLRLLPYEAFADLPQ